MSSLLSPGRGLSGSSCLAADRRRLTNSTNGYSLIDTISKFLFRSPVVVTMRRTLPLSSVMGAQLDVCAGCPSVMTG